MPDPPAWLWSRRLFLTSLKGPAVDPLPNQLMWGIHRAGCLTEGRGSGEAEERPVQVESVNILSELPGVSCASRLARFAEALDSELGADITASAFWADHFGRGW